MNDLAAELRGICENATDSQISIVVIKIITEK